MTPESEKKKPRRIIEMVDPPEHVDSENGPTLKEKINKLIWEYGDPNKTLGEADNLAYHIYSEITSRCEGDQ